jgi:hypothetical protein
MNARSDVYVTEIEILKPQVGMESVNTETKYIPKDFKSNWL